MSRNDPAIHPVPSSPQFTDAMIEVEVKVVFNGLNEVRGTFADGSAASGEVLGLIQRGLSTPLAVDRRRGVAHFKRAVLNLPAIRSISSALERHQPQVILAVKPISRGQNLSDHLLKHTLLQNEVVHCMISAVPADTSDTPSAEQNSGILRGFDRLIDAGISREEITAMRSQFLSARDSLFRENGAEGSEQTALNMEDAWLDGMGAGGDGGGGGDTQQGGGGGGGSSAARYATPNDANITLEVDPPETPSVEPEAVGFGYLAGFFGGLSSLAYLRSEWLLQTGVALGLLVNFSLSFIAVLGDQAP